LTGDAKMTRARFHVGGRLWIGLPPELPSGHLEFSFMRLRWSHSSAGYLSPLKLPLEVPETGRHGEHDADRVDRSSQHDDEYPPGYENGDISSPSTTSAGRATRP
jgi:hypothetical protein